MIAKGLIYSLPIALALSGCGSDDDKESTYQVGGDVQGLNGSLSLKVGSEFVLLTNSGKFTVPNRFGPTNELNAAIVLQPQGQTCQITSDTPIKLSQDYADLMVKCESSSKVQGQLSNYYTGQALADVLVELFAMRDGQMERLKSAITDAAGRYSIQGLPSLTNFNLRFSADGVTNNTISVAAQNDDRELTIEPVFMLPAGGEQALNMTQPASVVVDGKTVIQLPANSLVTSSGGVVDSASARVRVIDPSADPELMPGDYESRDENDNARLIESFGALNATFTDSNGNALNLATGQQATIRIPLAQEANSAPASVPLFYFDEVRGYWVEEGSAALINDGGQRFYEGKVSHFTTWSADLAYNTIQMSGCVVDEDGNEVANARVRAQGSDFIGQSQVLANSNGQFSLAVRPNSRLFVSAFDGAQTNTRTINSGANDFTLNSCISLSDAATTITLTWGVNPRDLDSHLFVPVAADGDTHIYFSNKSATYQNATIDLDVDDTSSFGPEVVTLSDYPAAGRYRYLVHHYSGSENIKTSEARVELNLQGQRHVFTPPQNSDAQRYWAVFDLVVDEQNRVTLEEQNRYQWSSLPVSAPMSLSLGQPQLQAAELFTKPYAH